ncbi:MAG: UDP-N-acetylmuramate--L-alanine ligase [Aerococcus sp.]|nr:UDP-N-acetylmuramate--L-alanine ligase [Aerococcus sp.]
MNSETIYHFTGIKGTGMSALALVLHGAGCHVQGSDVLEHFYTEKGLHEAGIPILPFSEDNIQPGMVVICGNAFSDEHPEIVQAKALGNTVIRYHDFLGNWIKKYTSVAITGSHGKTTTTGIMSHVLSDNIPTSYLIGDGSGKGAMDSEYFVLEADEYREHFLAYEPDYAIFTNIDFDHPDFYHNLEEVYDANRKFANQVKKKVIAYGDDPMLARFSDLPDIWYYGFNDSDDIVAKNIEKDTHGSSFDIYVHDDFYGHFQINQFGDHNILNTTAVIAFCYFEGFPAEVVNKSLATFGGVTRRFNERKVDSNILIDDYAHHPSEIKATIQAARQKYPDRPVIGIFQPHTYSRTKALLTPFAASLSLADEVYLCDIFSSAREQDNHEITSMAIADKMSVPARQLTSDTIDQLLQYHDAVLLFMGAGDVMKYADDYIEALTAANNAN